MQLRSQSIDELKTAMPPPGSPRTASSPTSQSSRITSLIGDVRSPIFGSGCPTERPRVPLLDQEAGDAGEAVRAIDRREHDEDVGDRAHS